VKILNAEEMRSADAATFSTFGIPSRAVMESAGREVAAFLLERYAERLSDGVVIITGSGNNGGDGYVAGRALTNIGLRVKIAALKPPAQLSGDAADAAQAYIRSGGDVVEISSAEQLSALFENDRAAVVVDAIFGTGIRGALSGLPAAVVSTVNERAEKGRFSVVSVDLPSGLSSDSGEVAGAMIRASETLALQCLKVGHVIFPAAEYCGEVFVADIGIGAQLPQIRDIRRELLTESRIQQILRTLPSLQSSAHKGSRGHVLVIGGSRGKLGAPKLSGQAALHAGAGLATLLVPSQTVETLSTQLLELMCESLPEHDSPQQAQPQQSSGGQLTRLLAGKDAVVIGPGLGQQPETVTFLRTVLAEVRQRQLPCVLDADGLNIVAAHPELQSLLSEQVILTPHPGEMARLAGMETAAVQRDRLGCALQMSKRLNCLLVLKGARTVIVAPDGSLWVNPAATSVLATGGSGDALSGILGALLAQGCSARDAACCGVFLHGAAGELLEQTRQGVFGVLAGDILTTVPQVMNTLLAARLPQVPRRIQGVFRSGGRSRGDI
jgi:NAD(P)H-hydrate epimerase